MNCHLAYAVVVIGFGTLHGKQRPFLGRNGLPPVLRSADWCDSASRHELSRIQAG